MVYLIDDGGEVFRIVLEVHVIDIYGEHLAAILMTDEFFIVLIQSGEVFDGDGLLVITPSLLNVANQMGDGCPQIYHEVGEAGNVGHLLEQFHIGFKVAFGEVALLVVVAGKDIDSSKMLRS